MYVHTCSVAQLCPALWDPMDCNMPGYLPFTISWSLLRLMSIDSVMPFNHLIFSHPLLLLPSIFPSIRVFSNESVLCIRWPKYWNLSFSISPSNEYSGLISFRIVWFDLAVQGTLKSLLQHHSSEASIELSPTQLSPKIEISCPYSLPAARYFQMSQFFAWGGQSIGASASASVLPMIIQGWFPLGLTGLISLQSKGLSRVFSNITIQKHQFFHAQPSLCPPLTSIHDYWKTIALTRQTFVDKVMSLLLNMLSRFVIAFLLKSKHFFKNINLFILIGG